ncbi:MAG: hypothetical protein QW579_02950 [Desulfurococcaceae archaeon]
MIIIRIPKEQKATRIIRRVRGFLKEGIVLGEIASSDIYIYLYVPDEALSVALAYRTYLEAERSMLSVEAFYSMPVDLAKILPTDVKSVGEKWYSRRRLSKSDISLLKNRFITPNILEVILK